MDYQKEESFSFSFGSFRWWVGVVEDRFDPKKLGRLRVRVMGYHTEDKKDIPSEKLFWAYPIQPIVSAAMNGIGVSPTGIVEGTWVVGFWRDNEDSQDMFIMGTIGGIPREKNPSKGFFDPNGVYPKDDFMNEPDTNRLARNEKISETIVPKKEKERDLGVKTALGGEWDQPEIPYNAKYPFNHVRETESGHIEEWDDTENHERFHRYHRSGTYVEEFPDGRQVRHIENDKYEIVHGNDHIHIKGNNHDLKITVDGNCKLLVKGNLDVEVGGDYNTWVHGNYRILVDGTFQMESKRYVWLNSPLGRRSFDINSQFAPKFKWASGL